MLCCIDRSNSYLVNSMQITVTWEMTHQSAKSGLVYCVGIYSLCIYQYVYTYCS